MVPRTTVRIVLLALVSAPFCRESPAVGRLAVDPRQVRMGGAPCASLRLDWFPARELERRRSPPTVFVHLLNPPRRDHSTRRVAATFDHPLPEPWQPGHPQSYSIRICRSAVDPPPAAGSYGLSVGLYDGAWGYRWRLAAEGPEIDRREYRVASVDFGVPEAARAAGHVTK